MNKRAKKLILCGGLFCVVLFGLTHSSSCTAFFRSIRGIQHNSISTASLSFVVQEAFESAKILSDSNAYSLSIRNTGTIPLQYKITHIKTSPACEKHLRYKQQGESNALTNFLPHYLAVKKEHALTVFLSEDTTEPLSCKVTFDLLAWQTNFSSNKRGFSQIKRISASLSYTPPVQEILPEQEPAPTPQVEPSQLPQESLNNSDLPITSPENSDPTQKQENLDITQPTEKTVERENTKEAETNEGTDSDRELPSNDENK